MLFVCVGLPSRFGEWCDAATAMLAEKALGDVEGINANTVEEFAYAVMSARASHAVLGSRQTLGRLWGLLGETERPFIVALDDPYSALRNLVDNHGVEFAEAVRIVARSCAAIVSCAAFPGALALRPVEGDMGAVAAAIAGHFGFAVSQADIQEIVEALGELDPTTEPDGWRDDLEEAQRALAAGALEPFAAHLAGADLGPITWERGLFFMDEERPEGRHQPASRPADITGRPRCVVYGPYISLPPGSWSATVALGFSPEAADMSYLVEVHAPTLLAQLRIQPGPQRAVEANLNFSVSEPNMIDVRVLSERAAFDGRLALGHVIVTPHASMRPQTQDYFDATLV